jgi:hypothetical protein
VPDTGLNPTKAAVGVSSRGARGQTKIDEDDKERGIFRRAGEEESLRTAAPKGTDDIWGGFFASRRAGAAC